MLFCDGSSRKRPVAGQQVEDIDSMAAVAADGLTAEYVQLEAKPFTGHWMVLVTSTMVVQIGREDIAVVRRLRVPAGRWVSCCPLMVPHTARWNATTMRPEDALLCGPGGVFRVRSRRNALCGYEC